MHLVAELCDLKEIRSLVLACKDNYFNLFVNPDLWRKLLMRDFGVTTPLQKHADLQNLYREIYAERERIIAYVQVILNRGTRQATQRHISLDDDCFEVGVEQNHVNFKNSMSLTDQLKLNHHKEFLLNARRTNLEVDSHNLAQNNAVLKKVFHSIFFAPADNTTDAIRDICLSAQKQRNQNLEISNHSELGMAMLIIKLSGICGATHCLQGLLEKLPGLYKTLFLSNFGGNLVRDAALYARDDLLQILINNNASTESPAQYDDFFPENELLPLASSVKAVREFYHLVLNRGEKLTEHRLTLNKFNCIFNLLSARNTDADRYRVEYMASIFGPSVSLTSTARSLAETVMKEVKKDLRLNSNEKDLLIELLTKITMAKPAAVIDQQDEAESPTKKARIALRGMNFGSDEE
jgi:hypothetical protein